MNAMRYPDLFTDHLPDSPVDRANLHTETIYDEQCVVDERAGLRPTDVIQMKLLRLLPSAAVPVSCLHTRRDTRR